MRADIVWEYDTGEGLDLFRISREPSIMGRTLSEGEGGWRLGWDRNRGRRTGSTSFFLSSKRERTSFDVVRDLRADVTLDLNTVMF